MKLIDLGVIALGIVCAVLAHYFPDVREYLLFLGGGLTGWGALNRPSAGKTAAPATCLALVLGAGLCLHGSPARADANDPVTGGCAIGDAFSSCQLSYQFSVSMPVTAWDISKGHFSGGLGSDVTLGPCYGISWRPDSWYSPGVDLCGALVASSASPDRGLLAVMFHFAHAVSLGFGKMKGDGNPWLVLVAPRVPLL